MAGRATSRKEERCCHHLTRARDICRSSRDSRCIVGRGRRRVRNGPSDGVAVGPGATRERGCLAWSRRVRARGGVGAPGGAGGADQGAGCREHAPGRHRRRVRAVNFYRPHRAGARPGPPRRRGGRIAARRRRAGGNPLAAGVIAFGAGWLVSSLLPRHRRAAGGHTGQGRCGRASPPGRRPTR